MADCIFCKIISHEAPAYIVDDNEYAIAILPKDMECFWHTLIIPKQHFENIFDIDESYMKEVIAFVQKIASKYKNGLWATWVNILNASGKDAQQSVFHLHFHLIPRFPDDKMDVWPKLEKYNWNHAVDLQNIKNQIF